MSGPLASVIVPVYNVEPYLAQCVASLRGQTCPDLEIILVDDGSTDGSGLLCDGFAREDPRIRVIHKANGGLSSARNAGLDRARGTYIYFVDSDDWAERDMVAESAKIMERWGCGQCAWGNSVVEEGKADRYWGRRRPLTLRFPTPERRGRFLCQWLLAYRLGWSVWSRVFRRDVIERYGLRFQDEREIGAEDLDFTFRYLARCGSLRYLPRSLYAYRQRPDSIMHTGTLQRRTACMLRMVRRQEELLSGEALFRRFYVYGGVILAGTLDNFIKDQPVEAGLAQALDCFRSGEDWDYLRAQAALALENRAEIRRWCGWRLGGRVCAFYQYVLDQDPGPLRRWDRVYRCYDTLRDAKSRLLYRR